jgi:hypothetical protein
MPCKTARLKPEKENGAETARSGSHLPTTERKEHQP